MTSLRKSGKASVLAIAIASTFVAAPALAQAFAPGYFIEVQGPQKGRPGPGPGPAPGRGFDRRGGPPPDFRPSQPPPGRAGQLTDDERRALHQDLDKANRELYRRRGP